MSDVINCSHCKSENVRSIDNQPLYHPSKQDIIGRSDVPKFDNEIYVEFICDDCHKKHTKVFNLVLQTK